MSQQRISVPFDMRKVHTKVFGLITKRQLVCFSLAAAAGIPTYMVFSHISADIAAILMVVTALPFFMASLPPKNELYLEKRIFNYIKWNFIFPKTRLKGKGGSTSESKEKDITGKHKDTDKGKNIQQRRAHPDNNTRHTSS